MVEAGARVRTRVMCWRYGGLNHCVPRIKCRTFTTLVEETHRQTCRISGRACHAHHDALLNIRLDSTSTRENLIHFYGYIQIP